MESQGAFVQPEGEQDPCLLGMNIIPQLGIKLIRDTIILSQEFNPGVAKVHLVSAVAIPSHHGKVIAATLSQVGFNTKDFVFEPIVMICCNLSE